MWEGEGTAVATQRETGHLLIPVPEQKPLYLRSPFCNKAAL